jgi:hypothetical protein
MKVTVAVSSVASGMKPRSKNVPSLARPIVASMPARPLHFVGEAELNHVFNPTARWPVIMTGGDATAVYSGFCLV